MEAEPVSGKTKTVLILEDDKHLQELLKVAIKEIGHKVQLASSAQQAMDQFEKGLVPDLVILDLGLPGMDGMEFLTLIQKRYPFIKAIVASGREGVDSIVETMRLGALDFIRKPFELKTIQNSVNEALQFQELQLGLERKKRQSVFNDELPFLYASSSMAEIMETIQQVSATNVPVLITGESGVGKEVVARELHRRSTRFNKPFLKVNCAALPANLLEGELFGYERGAFTGAVKAKPAKFEKASEGTLFLDEIGELEHSIQAKFLHVLQDGSFTRLGSNKMLRSGARIIVATNRDIEKAVKSGAFRSDLYYRLNVIRIHIPPLRERSSDIPILAEYFLDIDNRKFGKSVRFDTETLEYITKYSWPGNVRELQNAISRYVVLGKFAHETGVNVFLKVDLPEESMEPEEPGITAGEGHFEEGSSYEGLTLKEIAREASRRAEKDAILRALEATRWNKSKAAKILKVSYKALLYKIKDCGIEPKDIGG
jgi:two-component system response regulator AtoC